MKPPIVILAGGKGTRLGDLTKDCPKPMIPIFGIPFLKLLIDSYRKQGFENFIVSTGYLAEVIEGYDFGPGVQFIRDSDDYLGKEGVLLKLDFYPYWIVNGDTYITSPLPEVDEDTTVLVHNNTDAGAQYIMPYTPLVKVVKCGKFYDIGTPEGLEEFRSYYENICG